MFWSYGKAQTILTILNYLKRDLLIKYMGLSVVRRELKYTDWSSLINQVNNYLMQWHTKKTYLSYSGRLQLVKWILYGKLQY